MSKKDKEVIQKLKEAGIDLTKQIDKGNDPSYELPVRTLNNVFFDQKTKTIRLGDRKSTRQFLNIAHTRKFMQTMLVAAEIKKVIAEEATVSIRDLYYALKHTIEGTEENTFENQGESIIPDETVLVRLNGKLKLTTAREAVEFAEKHGKIEVDEPERKIISVEGINVCGFDENQKIKEFKSQYIIIHPPNEVVKINTSSGRSITTTKSHSLFTVSQGQPIEAKAGELKAGDYLALPRKIKVNENHESINLIYSLIENAPEKELKTVYLKSDKKTIKEILARIGKEKLKEAIKKMNFKNVWSDVAANWKHWNTVPLQLIKETNPKIDDLTEKIKISSTSGKHQYNAVIKKNRELGIIFGALLSEGCFSRVKGRPKEHRISIDNKDKEYLEEFRNSFEKTFRKLPSEKLHAHKDGTFRFNIGYNLLAKIMKFGLGVKFEKAWNKEIPSILLDSPKDCVQAFIYSFRKGDGSKGSRFEIRFHTTSEKLVNGITFLLLRLGMFPNIYEYKREKPRHKAFEVRVGCRDYSKELSKTTLDYTSEFEKFTSHSSDKIPQISGLIKEARKGIKLTEQKHKELNFNQLEKSSTISRPMLAKVLSNLGSSNQFTQQLQEILQSDIYWDKIKSIEPAEVPEYTMDFTVKSCQNFVGGKGLMLLHNSDPIIEDLESSLNLLREELHLAASSKGVISGSLKIKDGKDTIDLAKMGSGGWGVPSNVEPDKIEIKDLSAEYVLFIEKDAVWKRFNEDQYWKKHNCIIITGRGQPSRAERRFVQRLNKEHKLPVFALMDADPWGMYIYSVIKQGSISLSYSEEKLATPDTKYIGLTVSDVETFKIPKEVTIKLNKLDVKRINEMKGYDWFKKKEWQQEFDLMKEKEIKLELEALSKKGIRFITEEYLPQKIKSKNFLP